MAIANLTSMVERDRLTCLAWMLAKGLLEIKLAVPKKIRDRGIYHEKVGIFSDSEGNFVTFMGSANESYSALIENFECIDVYCSWDMPFRRRALRKVENFQRLWDNRTANLDVLEFPEAVRQNLLKLCPQEPPLIEPRVSELSGSYSTFGSSLKGVPQIPSWLKLRPYQQQAIANWFANKGRGTLKMATGSGKTITALVIAAELYRKSVEQNKLLQGLLIVCPYRHLVTQWAEETRQFGLQPILAFETVQSWQGELQSQLLAVLSGKQRFVTVITTNATLMRDSLQSQLQFSQSDRSLLGMRHTT